MEIYPLLKFVHVLLAMVAVGANVTYGVWIGRAAREPQFLPFALRGVKFLDDRVANPAYVLLLLTGGATAAVGKVSFSTPWLVTSLVLYLVMSVVGLMGYTPTLRRQIAGLDAGGPTSAEYRALAARSQRLGAVLGVLVVLIALLMVTKPALWAAAGS
jgi:uncharacterized membrane protein